MSDEHIGHKENRFLQRGIFSSTDFTAFQKSEVFDCLCSSLIGIPTSSSIYEDLY